VLTREPQSKKERLISCLMTCWPNSCPLCNEVSDTT